ncbi:hypothetical protein [Coleofasciculus sp. G2-EDA-02]|uniref:hypothetical protein n=1 Tax=Coleofasciculus sp. G2-EDA-02 TaxID=3069529 RepID=UPI0033030C5B
MSKFLRLHHNRVQALRNLWAQALRNLWAQALRNLWAQALRPYRIKYKNGRQNGEFGDLLFELAKINRIIHLYIQLEIDEVTFSL